MQLTPAASAEFRPILDALGEQRFEGEMLRYLHRNAGVEHYTAYRVAARAELLGGASTHGIHAKDTPRVAAGLTARSFSDLAQARAATTSYGPDVFRVDLRDTDDAILRDAFDSYRIIDRILVCGERADGWYAISLLRSSESGPFDDRQITELVGCASLTVSAVAKQWALRGTPTGLPDSFQSIAVIERVLIRSNLGLTRRELQVCARLLFGISALGIANDLNLTEDTIATYRKRLYQRLKVSSRHELFKLYLSLV